VCLYIYSIFLVRFTDWTPWPVPIQTWFLKVLILSHILVGHLGRGIGPSQCFHLHRTAQERHEDIHPCIERESNPGSQCSCGPRHKPLRNFESLTQYKHVARRNKFQNLPTSHQLMTPSVCFCLLHTCVCKWKDFDVKFYYFPVFSGCRRRP
jgi:hypothetical protein